MLEYTSSTILSIPVLNDSLFSPSPFTTNFGTLSINLATTSFTLAFSNFVFWNSSNVKVPSLFASNKSNISSISDEIIKLNQFGISTGEAFIKLSEKSPFVIIFPLLIHR